MVLGYKDVERIKKAKKTAKGAAERAGTTRCTKRYASLTHFSYTITERTWKKVKHCLRTENDRSSPLQQTRYNPTMKIQGPKIAAMREAAYVSRRYFQLKTEYTVTDTYRHRMGKAETD